MRKLLLISLMIVSLLGLYGCGGAPQSSSDSDSGNGEGYTATWKFAHNETDQGAFQVYAEKFKESVEQKSGGKIKVEIYPSGTLGTGDSIIELLQQGGIEFALADSGYIGSFIPEAQLFRVHYWLSDDKAINRQLLDSSEAIGMLNNLFEQKDMKVLGHISEGFTVWTGNKPFTSVDDFKGLKMRVVPTPILIDTYKAYGANPTTIDYSELYSALQLGTVEAQENPLSSIKELNLNEVQKYVTLSNHYAFIASYVTNKQFYDSLPDDVKTMLEDITQELAPWYDDYITQNDEALVKEFENKGMQVVTLTDEQRAAFKKFNEDNREIFRNTLGDAGMDILFKMDEEKKALENAQ